MADGYLLSRQTLEMIRRDHFDLRTQIKNLRNSVHRTSRAAGMREEQVIVKLTADLKAIELTASPPKMHNETGIVQVLKVDLKLTYGEVNESAQQRKVVVYNATTTEFKKDDLVICQRNSLTGRFLIGSAPAKMVRFKLKQNPQAYQRPSDSAVQYWFATADLLDFEFDENNDDSTDNGLSLGGTAGDEITVYDPYGKFRFAKGPRTHSDGSTQLDGSGGYAELIDGNYHIIECETVAKFIKFSVDNLAGYTQTDAIWNIDYDFEILDGIHPGAISTVNNWRIDNVSPTQYLFEAVDGAKGIAQFQDDLQSSGSFFYEISQLEVDCGTT